MHHPPLELRQPRKIGGVAVGVVVVAGAHPQKIAAQLPSLFGRPALHSEQPACLRAGPGRFHHPVAQVDMRQQPMLAGGVLEVLQDGRAVGYRLAIGPGLKRVAQGVHVRVRTHARVAKQVPGAAQALAPFQNGKALTRAALLQVHCAANARQTRAHNQGVKVLQAHATNTRASRPIEHQYKSRSQPTLGNTTPWVMPPLRTRPRSLPVSTSSTTTSSPQRR